MPEWFIGIDLITIARHPGAGPDRSSSPRSCWRSCSARTIFGRQIYQIGTNEIAARHAGIRTRAHQDRRCSSRSGVVSALAGMMFASRLGSVRYDLGLGGELQMVLMAMLGGTYIFGGRGTILGTFLAAWLLSIMTTGMIVANWLPATQLCRARRAAHRLDHRHQFHLFPHPKVAGVSAGQPASTGGSKCLREHLVAGVAALGLAVTFATGAFAAGHDFKIVYIGKNTGNPYFDSITGGFKDACKPRSAASSSSSPRPPPKRPRRSRSSTRRSSAASTSSPSRRTAPTRMNQVLDDARAKGILVLAVNGDLVGNESHRDANILPVDFTKTGPNQVELMGSLIGYKGDIAILSATTEAPDQNTWIAAMKKTLAEDPKYKDMKLVATVYGDDQPEKSTTEMEAPALELSRPRGRHRADDGGRCGGRPGRAAARHRRQGPRDRPRPAERNAATSSRTAPVKAFQLWSPYNEGWLAAYFADGVINGTIKNEVGTKFDVPTLGTITIGDKNVMNTQAELTTFDAKNIDQFNF